MKYVRSERLDDLLWITFDRPEKLNVLDESDLTELCKTIEDLDSDVAAIVFSGSGSRSFCAGMNLETFTNLTPQTAKEFIRRLSAVMAAIRHSSVVTLAVVNGYCLGAGFELALACDLRVVSSTAVFGLPEIKVGIPSVIDAALLERFVGLSRAREMILTGDLYSLDQLPPHSLANAIVEPAQLQAVAEEILERISGHTRAATSAQRRLFDVWLNHPLDASIEASIEEFGDVFRSSETLRQIALHAERITGRKDSHES